MRRTRGGPASSSRERASPASRSKACWAVLEVAGALSGPGLAGARSGRLPVVDLEAPATIVFTSGTTGRPRGARLSHGNHAASADAWAALLEPRPTDRWLACLPLFHVAGLAIVVRASRWRVPLEVLPHFDATKVAARMAAGVSHLSLVPAQLEQVMAAWAGRPVPSDAAGHPAGRGADPRSHADASARRRACRC